MAGLVAISAMLLLLFIFFATRSVLDIWDRIQELPVALFYTYLTMIAAFIIGAIWLVYKLLKPSTALIDNENVTEESVLEEIERAEHFGMDTNELRRELEQLQARKESGTIYVALFGNVSTGKSSIIKSLLPDADIDINVRGGSTQEISQYTWSSGSGDQLVLTDLPGRNEASGSLDEIASDEAIRAQVVVYVTDSDLSRTQFNDIQELLSFGKPMIVVLNKSDRYNEEERQLLKQRFDERISDKARLVFVQSGGEEEVVRINLDQKRFDLKGNIENNFLIFEEARVRFGYADYKHVELEGDEIGTRFTNKGWEGRFELIQQRSGNVHGSMGIQLRDREFSAIGEEAFVPPNDTFQWGIFVVEEIEVEPVTFEFGARYDHQDTESAALGISRDFDNLSFSAGAAFHPTENDLIGISVSRSERSPTPEELFSNGPHLATNAFEVGNANLDTEKAISAELTFKRNLGAFSGSVNIYHTWYKDFIYEHETGLEMDELNLLEFRARDANFYGAEIDLSYAIVEQQDYNVLLKASADFVHARFTDDSIIPRIPAASARVGIEYQSEYFDLGGDVGITASKNKTAANILPTEDYTTIDLSATWRPFGMDKDLAVRVQALNVTNAERRQHTSFLKDLVPMPGRNFRLTLNYGF